MSQDFNGLDEEEEYEEVDPKKQVSNYREMKSTNKKDIEKVDNEHYDEAIVMNESDDNLSDNKGHKDHIIGSSSKKNQMLHKFADEDINPPQKASTQIPLPKFDISSFDKLTSNPDYKSLMGFMNRFQVAEIHLDTKIKPFIPSYIPSIGEVDAFLKINRPDKVQEDLGLSVIDEPTIEGVDANIFYLKLIYLKKNVGNVNLSISSIPNAEKKPQSIQSWIDKIADLHKDKMSSSVPYSKNMPEIESLMQIWPEKMEQGLNEVKFPDENVNLGTDIYAKIICNLLDIPIHKVNSNNSLIEALHVLFTLYSVVKENQAYKNIEKTENFQFKKFT